MDLLNPVIWLAGALAVAAIIIITPRNKDEWYHREAGFGKPYHGEQRAMGCTYAVMFTSLFLALAFATVGVFLGNFLMLTAALGCLILFLAGMGQSAENDRKDAAEDGIRVDYNRNGGIPAMIAMLAISITVAVALVLGGLVFLIGR